VGAAGPLALVLRDLETTGLVSMSLEAARSALRDSGRVSSPGATRPLPPLSQNPDQEITCLRGQLDP